MLVVVSAAAAVVLNWCCISILIIICFLVLGAQQYIATVYLASWCGVIDMH